MTQAAHSYNPKPISQASIIRTAMNMLQRLGQHPRQTIQRVTLLHRFEGGAGQQRAPIALQTLIDSGYVRDVDGIQLTAKGRNTCKYNSNLH